MSRHLFIVVILGGLIALIAWQEHRIQQQTERASRAEQVAKTNRYALRNLRRELLEKHQALQQLQKQEQHLTNLVDQRNLTIRQLERDNETYRNWADQPLPDTARRLRQRPAITGAAEFAKHLSGTETLQPAASQPKPQRRPDN